VACAQNYEKAVELYQFVISNSRTPELRGHALLNLGMMHHFGLGTPVDLDMAQIYYEKAMKEDASSSYTTPVYLLNLYSKWQKLDIIDTLSKFFLFRISSPSGPSVMGNTQPEGLFGTSLPRNQTLIGMAIILYWLTVAGMVKFLRRDHASNVTNNR
jgi:hypothetical protein